MQASQRWLEVHRHDGPSDLVARAATVEMDSETGDFVQVTGSKEVRPEGQAVTAPRAPHLGLGPQDLGKHVHSSDLRVRHFRAGSRFGRAERSRALMSVAQAASTRGTSPEDADNRERDYRFDVLGRGNSSVSCPTRRSLRSEARGTAPDRRDLRNSGLSSAWLWAAFTYRLRRKSRRALGVVVRASQHRTEVPRQDEPSDLMAHGAIFGTDSETGDCAQVTGSKEVRPEGRAQTAQHEPLPEPGPQVFEEPVRGSTLRERHFRAGRR